MASILQDSLTRDLRSRAFANLVDDRYRVDATPILVYWLERPGGQVGPCPESALPYLRWQFDLTSPFWQKLLAHAQAGTTRDLIRTGIRLHATRGTPRALVDLLAALGWPDSTIQEGQDSWGGTYWPADQGWAAVRINLGQIRPVDRPDVIAWDATTQYQIGDLVTFPGVAGSFFVATLPSLDVQPFYDLVSEVPSMDYLRDVATLRTWHWLESSEFRVPSLDDIDLLIEAFEFIAPRRCILDRILASLPGIEDSSQNEHDAFSIGTIAVDPFVDAEGYTTELFVGPIDGLTDSEEWAPTYDGSYDHDRAITYAGELVGDSDILYVGGVLAVEGGSL